MYNVVFAGFLVLCHVSVSIGQTFEDAIALKHHLFITKAYDKKIRPVINQSDPIVVDVSLILLAINNLDEVNEVLQTTGFLAIDWHDDLLTWDPNDFGGLQQYFYPQDDIWTPDVALKNSYQEYKQLGVKTLNVMVYSDGSIRWFPFQVFQSTCSIEILNFPYDVQECSLTFVAWSYTKNEVDMISERGVILSEYESNSAWEIIESSSSVREESGDTEISFKFKIRRKPLYVIISIVLPIILLAIANIFVFVLPCESGERAGYAMTVFLSLAVFLTIVSTTLPANSDTVAILSIFLIIQTVQSTVITLIALITIRVSFLDDNEPKPACVLSMMRCWDRLKCRSGKRSDRTKAGNQRGKHSRDEPMFWSGRQSLEREYPYVLRGSRVYNRYTDEWERQKEKGREKEREKEIEKERKKESEEQHSWKSFVNFLDCIFIMIFACVLVVSTFVCFYVAANG